MRLPSASDFAAGRRALGGRCESLGRAKRARVAHSSEADNRRHLPLATLLNRPQPVLEVSFRPLCIEGYFTGNMGKQVRPTHCI